ncbi:MAG: RNA pyrophosphohydrolase [Candidatus Fonsibacter sp.]|nr:RNA pyrophosphohydrolase [Candidatus Fonsibacter sp.]
MLLNHETKVFIGKRIDSTKAWQMPQGGVDNKEDFESAAKRELKEETGIISIEIIKKSGKEFIYDLPNELLGKIWNGKYKGQKQTWFLAKFIGEYSEINIKQKKAEFCEWRWAQPLELPKLIVPFKKKLYKEVIEEFKKYL